MHSYFRVTMKREKEKSIFRFQISKPVRDEKIRACMIGMDDKK